MSTSSVLILAGVILFIVGLASMGSHQSGGVSLSNRAFNIGGSVTQTTTVGDVKGEPAKAGKTDWIGLIVALLGLATAIFGWLKGSG